MLTLTLIQLVLPFFNQFTETALSFNVLSDPSLLLFVVSLLLVGSLASGIYPALVISSYKPLSVLSGSFKNSSKGRVLRKGLVVFQFMITVVSLVGTAVIYAQVDQMKKEELGRG